MRVGLLLAAVAAPVVFRLALAIELPGEVQAQDLRGLAADLGVSLAAALGLFATARLSRGATVALATAFFLLNHANYENVLALSALARWQDAIYVLDPTFLRGSAFALANPVVSLGALCATAGLAFFGAARPRHQAAPWRSTLAGALVLSAIAFAWPLSDHIAYWRQTNFIVDNLAHLGGGAADDGAALARFRDPPRAMLDRLPSLRADTSGTVRTEVPVGGRPRNVLLVIVESLSGGHIESIAARHGLRTSHRLEALDRLARENLTATSFVAHNRKTNRGEYAVLCGELPNLLAGEPKMSEHVQGGWRQCLPKVLRDQGYATVYVQAAPLPFMLKDQFMPVAGFERVLGDADLETVRWRTHWGVDDRSLYEQALVVLDGLRAEARPWFVTLLTAGTHHPYTVPAEFDRLRDDPAARALAYADLAIGEFITALEARGVLDEALVLITSDESMGLAMREEPDALTTSLSQNWGVLIALTPGGRPAFVQEPYGQMDIAISVLDYLGLDSEGADFFGRSVFRRYDEGRWMFFANTNQLTIGAFDPFRRLVVCRAGEPLCRKYETARGRVFGPQRKPIPVDAQDEIVHAMAERSVRHAGRAPERRTVALVGEPVALLAPGARKVLFGGQYIDLRDDEWLELDLLVEARGSSGNVRLVHYTKQTRTWAAERAPGPGRMLVEREVEIPAGETFELRYTIAPAGAMQGIQSRATAQSRSAEPIELVLREATLTQRWTGDRPADEVTIRAERMGTTPRSGNGLRP